MPNDDYGYIDNLRTGGERVNPALDAALRPYVGLLASTQEMAKLYCAPLRWQQPNEESGDREYRVGTVTLIDTGTHLLGVTAAHVHTQLVARLESGEATGCQLGAVRFDPLSYLIDCDPEPGLDLATYRIPQIMVSGTRHQAHSAFQWPPPVPAVGDVALASGWPYRLAEDQVGEATDIMPADRVDLRLLSYWSVVADRSASRVICNADPGSSPAWTEESFRETMGRDGMSGGVLLTFGSRGLVTFPVVAAIVYGEHFGQLLARPLTFVNADGTLDRAAYEQALAGRDI